MYSVYYYSIMNTPARNLVLLRYCMDPRNANKTTGRFNFSARLFRLLFLMITNIINMVVTIPKRPAYVCYEVYLVTVAATAAEASWFVLKKVPPA